MCPLATYHSLMHPYPLKLLVAASHIRIACPVRLEKRPPCRRTMPCRTSCASHNQCKRIIWWQGGCIPRCSIQRMRMGLATASWQGHCSALSEIIPRTICKKTAVDCILGDTRLCRMRMARHLGFREGRGPDSAGNTWICPQNLRSPPDQAVRMMYAST